MQASLINAGAPSDRHPPRIRCGFPPSVVILCAWPWDGTAVGSWLSAGSIRIAKSAVLALRICYSTEPSGHAARLRRTRLRRWQSDEGNTSTEHMRRSRAMERRCT